MKSVTVTKAGKCGQLVRSNFLLCEDSGATGSCCSTGPDACKTKRATLPPKRVMHSIFLLVQNQQAPAACRAEGHPYQMQPPGSKSLLVQGVSIKLVDSMSTMAVDIVSCGSFAVPVPASHDYNHVKARSMIHVPFCAKIRKQLPMRAIHLPVNCDSQGSIE